VVVTLWRSAAGRALCAREGGRSDPEDHKRPESRWGVCDLRDRISHPPAGAKGPGCQWHSRQAIRPERRSSPFSPL